MKKLTIALLMLIFLLNLVSCAPAQPQNTTNSLPNGESTTTSTVSQPADPAVPDDLSLKILVANGNYPVDMRNYQQYYVWEVFAQWCAQMDLTVEWIIVDKEQYQESLMSYLNGAAEELPDAFWCTEEVLSVTARAQLVDSGKLFALEDILPYSDGTASGWFAEHPAFQRSTRYNGKTWWIGAYQEVLWHGETLPLGQGNPKGVVFRLDWYDLLVKRGAWDASRGYPDTAEELGLFLELCNACDANGDGSRNECYLSYISDMHSTGLGNLFGVPRNAFAPNLSSGTVDTAWTQPGSKALMELLIDWNSKGFFPEDLVGGSTGSTKYRTGNKVAVYNTYFCDNWAFDNTDIPEGADPAIVVGVIPDKAVHPDAYIAYESSSVMDETSLCFTSNLSHPAAAAALLDIICSDDYAHMLRWGTDFRVDEQGFLPTDDSTGQPIHIYPKLPGEDLFGEYAFPTVSEVSDIAKDEALCLSDESGEMHRIYLEAMTQWEVVYPDQVKPFFTPLTGEEAAALAEYEPVFQALSQELFLKLVTGEIPIDNWDDCIRRLNEEGHMADIQAIYQARFDRYLEK